MLSCNQSQEISQETVRRRVRDPLHPPPGVRTHSPRHTSLMAGAAKGEQPQQCPANNIGAAATVQDSTDNLGPTLASKRQRRPSVRFGEVGNQPLSIKPPVKSWKSNPHSNNKFSRLPIFTNLVSDCNHVPLSAENNNCGKLKTPNRPYNKRMRSDWTTTLSSEIEQAAAAVEAEGGGEDRENRGRDDDEDGGFRDDLEAEGSEIPPNLKEQQSPVHSSAAAVGMWQHPHRRRAIRDRVSEGILDPSDYGDRKCGFLDNDDNDGLRNWLMELGLGRYAPFFQIHEVDDRVLPFLTLEDLKDMGINAVGSRRKLYCAILKLRKNGCS
ncbi:hypothetical protein Nepgr_029237 [Nepenthes gracilis]|uniref:SAM domain-containing protein n=1 Tax=Nepenthes gracilis TaxID=150966 RepID=A0AAD3TEA8_NEPGR|nr:hypothetical protein Nepgr_029237 [Nepenthes gracilis]